MKKILEIVMATACFVVSSKFAFADTYKDNRGLTWDYTYYGRYGGAVINSVSYYFWLPSMEYPTYDPIGDIMIPTLQNYKPDYPDNIKAVRIGYGAFRSYNRLKGVVLPSSITVIYDSAFSFCTNLTYVSTRYDATGVELHAGVTDIGKYAFSGCSKLSSVCIPDSVVNLGARAFENCTGLKKVTIGNGVASIAGDVFSGCFGISDVTIPQTVCMTKLSDVFPSSYQNITNVVISDSVTQIGGNAFYGCSGVTSVRIPNGVTSIGENAFWGCSSLESVSIPESITIIGSGVFYACRNLTGVTIPRNVTSIGNLAFSGCSRLSSVAIPDSVTNIARNAFSGTPFYNNQPDGVVVLGKIAYKMKGYYPSEVNIPNGITIIGDSAFSGCEALERVTIPDCLVHISDQAFDGCSGLTSITFNGDAPSIGRDSFKGVDTACTIYVNKNSSGWNVPIPGVWNGLKIEYIPTMHIITFDANGGSLSSGATTRFVVSGAEVGSLPEPTLYGYTFSGWWTSPNGGSQISEETAVTANVTYYARWEPIPNPTLVIKDGVLTGVEDWNGCSSVTIPEGVTEIGNMAFFSCRNLLNVVMPRSLTSIGDSAFCYCSGLTSVTIPDGVTSIGDGAFYGCSSLTSITIPGSVSNVMDYAFYNCSKLARVTLQDGVEKIGEYVFGECKNLSNVAIPSSVIQVGNGAFSGTQFYNNQPDGMIVFGKVVYKMKGACPTNVTIPNGVESVAYSAFSGCDNLVSIAFPESMINIEAYAFQNCGSLVGINIPENVVNIGAGAFAGCSCLTSVSIPNKMFCIEDSVFANCSSLLNVILNGVTNIGMNAFSGCSSLANVIIPNTVSSIGENAFSGCTQLVSVTIPNSIERIGNDAFLGTPFYNNLPNGLIVFGKIAYKMKGTCPASVAIPAGVSSIEDYAFDGCYTLTKVTIPDGVTRIGNWAFSGCSLTNVSVPDSVTMIGDGAFCNCEKLTTVSIPNNVICIGDYVFSGCSELENVTMSEGVASVGRCAFRDCSKLVSMSIPASVTSIGECAFEGCSRLMSFVVHEANPLYKSNYGLLLSKDGTILISGINGNVLIPDGVTSIRDSAFCGCDGLTSVIIPVGMTNIEHSAFSGCSKLTSVTIPDGVISIGSYAFEGCSRLTSMTIPDGVARIGWSAFEGCGLTCVTIGSGIKSIESSLFENCTQLSSVAIPDSVTKIGTYAFSGCVKLVNVKIPNNVTSIESSAFKNCRALKIVMFGGDAPWVNYDAFSSVNSACTAYIMPSSSGWRISVPGTWNGINIAYLKEIEFNTAGGDAAFDSRYLIDGSTIGILPTPTWIGHSFAGWFTAKSGGTQIDASTIVSADATYYAHWIADKHSVVFNANGGFGGTTKVLDYGTSLGELPIPTHNDCYFDGWFTEAYGGNLISSSTTVSEDVTYYAHWRDAIPALPDSATGEMVAEALDGSADEKVLQKITAVGAYEKYRQWIVENSLSHKDMRASRNAWLAYIIDAPNAISRPLVTGDDLTVKSFVASATDEGRFNLVFNINGVELGEAATAGRLAEAFSIEGATELKDSLFSDDNVAISLERTVDGNAMATVMPKGRPQTFFMRVKIK